MSEEATVDETRDETEQVDTRSWWQRLLGQQPAVLIGAITALLPLLAGLGLTLSDHATAALVAFLGALLPLVQAVVTHNRTYPPAVVQRTVASERAAGYDAGVEQAEPAAEPAPEETPDIDPTAVAQLQAGLGVPVGV